jgi:hypothetical protein
VSIPPHVLPSLESHLRAFVGPEASSPLLTGPKKGGRLRRHPLRGAGLAWADTQGATTRELTARAGHASPAAALGYQHAAEDRDATIAEALSGLAESARNASISNPPRGYSRQRSRGAFRGNHPGLHF